MNTLRTCVLIFVGAGIGANARYWLTVWIAQRYGTAWGTVTVNVSGSILIGMLIGSLLGGRSTSDPWRVLMAVGLLGGYTTFSAFSMETVEMIRQGAWLRATGNALASVLGGVAGCGLGLVAGRAMAESGTR